MTERKLGIFVFVIGIFSMFVHTLFPFLWSLAGIQKDYPLVASQGPLMILPAFTPPIGALLLVVAGMIYGQATERRQA